MFMVDSLTFTPPPQGSEVTTAITNIKDSGNQYYFSGNYELAFRKYKKAVRYLSWWAFIFMLEKWSYNLFLVASDNSTLCYNFPRVKTVREDVHADNATLLIACLSNMAATNLRGSKFRLAHQLCTEVRYYYFPKILNLKVYYFYSLLNLLMYPLVFPGTWTKKRCKSIFSSGTSKLWIT